MQNYFIEEEPLIALCGYHLNFERNLLIPIVLLSTLALTILVLSILPDWLHKRRGKRRTAAWVANFSLRFFYEMLLEIALCLLIQFKAKGELTT